MTSTNFANLGAIGAKAAAGQVYGAGKARVHEQEMASMFSSMMNQTQQNTPVTEKSGSGASGTETVSGTAAYDRYQYQDNHVEEAKEVSVSDKIAGGEEELEQFENEVVKAVTEILEVDEEELTAVLEELGFTLYDLMEPQNLAQVVKQITGMQDDAQILLDGNFDRLMKDVGQIGGELFEKLDLEPSQKVEFVERMDALMVPTEEAAPVLSEAEIPAEILVDREGMPAESPEIPEDVAVKTEETVFAEKTATPEMAEASGKAAEPEVEVVREEPEPEPEETPVAAAPKEQAADTEGEEFSSDEEGETKPEGRPVARERENTVRQPQTEHMEPQSEPQAVQADPIAAAPSPNASYVSTHVMDIIRQVAENVRVVISSETTSMEMQLNPENLGKIYLNVTSEEGVVSAHLRAQDEAVKAALETQLATLRENLNQVGIKVDAIEVTVATHEFERNLEQDGSGQERRSAEEELPNRATRRNLNMNSLDELQGLMTEEEQLAAQIMRDNGNSLDYKV